MADEETIKAEQVQQGHPMAEDLLQRLAFKSSGGFLRATWPRNALIVLAAEVLSLRQQVAELRQKLEK